MQICYHQHKYYVLYFKTLYRIWILIGDGYKMYYYLICIGLLKHVFVMNVCTGKHTHCARDVSGQCHCVTLSAACHHSYPEWYLRDVIPHRTGRKNMLTKTRLLHRTYTSIVLGHDFCPTWLRYWNICTIWWGRLSKLNLARFSCYSGVIVNSNVKQSNHIKTWCDQ